MNAPIGLVVALESVSKLAASHPLVDLDWGPKGLLDGLNLRVSDTLDGIELAASHPLVDLDCRTRWSTWTGIPRDCWTA